MGVTFFDDLDELYHHAKFGEDRTMRAGCRCENMVFFVCFLSCSVSGAQCVRGVHSLNKQCVAVYCTISTSFSSFFSQGIALSQALYSSHIRR